MQSVVGESDSDSMEFVEELMQSVGGESDSDSMEFVEELMQSVGDEVESGSGSDWSDHEVYRELLHHEAHVFLPYEEDDSSSDEEMACPLPLYDNAPLSVSASWQAIMHFTLANHLSYAAMGQLLNLLKVHLPSRTLLPKNVASFRRHFVETVPPQLRYCSECFERVENGTKYCMNRECMEKQAEICYFVPVPVTTHLKQIFSGKCTNNTPAMFVCLST